MVLLAALTPPDAAAGVVAPRTYQRYSAAIMPTAYQPGRQQSRLSPTKPLAKKNLLSVSLPGLGTRRDVIAKARVALNSISPLAPLGTTKRLGVLIESGPKGDPPSPQSPVKAKIGFHCGQVTMEPFFAL